MIFPSSLPNYKGRKKHKSSYFPSHKRMTITRRNREEKNMNHVIFTTGKKGRKKTLYKYKYFFFPPRGGHGGK